jgi:MFS family permease
MASAFQDTPNAEFLVKLAFTMPALLTAIFAPLIGFMLDRWGRKPILIFSLILFGIAGSTGFVLNSLTGILISRAILGISVAGILIGFTTLIADYFTGVKLNQFMGYQGASIGMGGVVFLLISGYLADIGWRNPFLIHLFAFVILLGLLFTVDEPKMQARSESEDFHEGGNFPFKTIGFIYSIAFISMLIYFVFPVQLPFYLTEKVGVNKTLVGLALSLQSLTAVAIALKYERIKSYLSFLAIFSFAFLLLGVNHLIAALTLNYALIVLGLLIGGLGLGVLPPNVNVWAVSITPSHMHGRIIGGLTTFLFLGQFLTPFFTEPIVKKIGINSTFLIAGLVAILMVFAFIGILFIQSRSTDTPDNIF